MTLLVWYVVRICMCMCLWCAYICIYASVVCMHAKCCLSIIYSSGNTNRQQKASLAATHAQRFNANIAASLSHPSIYSKSAILGSIILKALSHQLVYIICICICCCCWCYHLLNSIAVHILTFSPIQTSSCTSTFNLRQVKSHEKKTLVNNVDRLTFSSSSSSNNTTIEV